MKITKENASIEALSTISYGKLKETFAELGIESVWKPGTKGATMIKNAVKKLAQIKDLSETLESPEEIETAIEEINVKEAEVVKADKKEAKRVAKLEDEAKVKEIKGEKKYTKEEIETMIFKLNRALVNCIHTHRVGTNRRLEVFEKMLADKDYI